MLQIIGWLGCVYLVVKGIQLLQVSLNSGTNRAAETVGYVGLIISVGAAMLFFVLINEQVGQMNSSPPFGSF